MWSTQLATRDRCVVAVQRDSRNNRKHWSQRELVSLDLHCLFIWVTPCCCGQWRQCASAFTVNEMEVCAFALVLRGGGARGCVMRKSINGPWGGGRLRISLLNGAVRRAVGVMGGAAFTRNLLIHFVTCYLWEFSLWRPLWETEKNPQLRNICSFQLNHLFQLLFPFALVA